VVSRLLGGCEDSLETKKAEEVCFA
jgi:hypothetical protein